MKTYEIWAEGFKNGDVSSNAFRLGVVEAENFDEACNKLKEQDEIYRKYLYKQPHGPHMFWNCRVYSTEEKARKRFG